MTHEYKSVSKTDKVKTYRWLFYMSIMPIICLFVFPIIVFPIPFKSIISLEILAALTVGVLFSLFFLAVNVYGLLIDKRRKILYVAMIIFMSVWILWALISWKYIQYMDYLLR